MLNIYRFLTGFSAPLLRWMLKNRQKRGKEHQSRLSERLGVASRPKPAHARLVWLHAASVGEAQSAMILIQELLAGDPALNVLVTTGTLTSAGILEKNLPSRAFHQFYPLDHPDWTARFLDHWQPDLILWMESELWPNMLSHIKKRQIPAALVNARLSDKAYRNWQTFRHTARTLLQAFHVVLTQTPRDQERFEALGATRVVTTDNLKYSAAPLGVDAAALQALKNVTANRDVWVYASTHKGEEALACRIHKKLRDTLPALLTIIVPRHPERRDEIRKICDDEQVSFTLRSNHKTLPGQSSDVYIADTMGELGLFYSLAPIALIGRSFSDDGGGGHNPIEAAQLDCAVLYGPHVQFQHDLFQEIRKAQAAIQVRTAEELENTLLWLLKNPDQTQDLQNRARAFAAAKTNVLRRVMDELKPLLEKTGIALTQPSKSSKKGYEL